MRGVKAGVAALCIYGGCALVVLSLQMQSLALGLIGLLLMGLAIPAAVVD